MSIPPPSLCSNGMFQSTASPETRKLTSRFPGQWGGFDPDFGGLGSVLDFLVPV